MPSSEAKKTKEPMADDTPLLMFIRLSDQVPLRCVGSPASHAAASDLYVSHRMTENI